MRHRLILLAGCLCFMGTAALGADNNIRSTPNDPLKVISKQEWSDLVTKPNKNGIATSILADHEDFWMEACMRVATGDAEQHNHWNDYIMVTEGDAKLLTAPPILRIPPAPPAKSTPRIWSAQTPPARMCIRVTS